MSPRQSIHPKFARYENLLVALIVVGGGAAASTRRTLKQVVANRMQRASGLSLNLENFVLCLKILTVYKATHAPALHVMPTGQIAPLSTIPSQLSSRPLQTSVLGLTFRMHCRVPLTQCRIPVAQTPNCPVEQATPPPGSPSSTVPLQLSSMPLQTSVDGVPGVQVCGVPFRQPGTERTQAPVPQVIMPQPLIHLAVTIVIKTITNLSGG